MKTYTDWGRAFSQMSLGTVQLGLDYGIANADGKPDFERSCAVLQTAVEGGVTALDTAANMPWPVIESLIPSTDLFLVDLKSIDPQVHHTYTRADNRLILDNIRALSQAGAQIEIRMPLIAGINDSADFARRSAEYLSALPIPPAVRLLPYHNYGLYKAQSIRRPMEEFCAPRQADDFAHVLRGYDLIVCAD